MAHLRREVAALRADARFERALHPVGDAPPPPRANEEAPASGDVDAILRGMLAAPAPGWSLPPEPGWSSPPAPGGGALVLGAGRPLPMPLPPASPTPDMSGLRGRPLSKGPGAPLSMRRSPVREPLQTPGTLLGQRQTSGAAPKETPAPQAVAEDGTGPRTRSRTARVRGRGR
jgi:hypothetical protein